MFKKIRNIFFLLTFFSFIFLITLHYFSEKNITYVNKSRASYLNSINNDKSNLPILRNDTHNIIVYINDLENFKNKRKKGSGKN